MEEQAATVLTILGIPAALLVVHLAVRAGAWLLLQVLDRTRQ